MSLSIYEAAKQALYLDTDKYNKHPSHKPLTLTRIP